MGTTILTGAQWGDEGKGKIIDILSENADVVVRAQGGNNAGHTVVVKGNTYKLHLTPSGILYNKTMCIIAAGCVVDPVVLINELDELKVKGVDLSYLKIDSRAHIILPYHIMLDGLGEKARGASDIGTTKKGIGPCYCDKAERIGIRMVDFINQKTFYEKLKFNIQIKNNILTKIYDEKPLDFEAIFVQYSKYAKILAQYVTDTTVIVYDALKAGKNILFEGAQGALLDLDLGTYPFVTSSHPIAGGACIGTGIGPFLIDQCIGIAKAYTTRVGKGPFPTELNDEVGEKIRQIGQEFGTTTGRARRCGWFDAVIVRFAVRVNGLTSLAVNKLDTLSGIGKLKICTAYEKNGAILKHFPADLSELEGCKPIYIELDGWEQNLENVKSFDELPKNAQKYIRAIEEQTDCKINMIGVGPRRDQNFYI